jgi:hypothetical protein
MLRDRVTVTVICESGEDKTVPSSITVVLRMIDVQLCTGY